MNQINWEWKYESNQLGKVITFWNYFRPKWRLFPWLATFYLPGSWCQVAAYCLIQILLPCFEFSYKVYTFYISLITCVQTALDGNEYESYKNNMMPIWIIYKYCNNELFACFVTISWPNVQPHILTKIPGRLVIYSLLYLVEHMEAEIILFNAQICLMSSM